MPELDFPSAPVVGQSYSRWQWDGEAWQISELASGPTVDSDEEYQIIMFSDGRVRAIPVTAEPPTIPDLAVPTIKISSVKLTWSGSVGATNYNVYRDDVLIGNTTNEFYRDSSVVVGETYVYRVRGVSLYELPSLPSVSRTAFVNPALNVTPIVNIRSYPPSEIALGNRAIIRVNARDLDGQLLTIDLDSSVGTLTPTADPSVWILDPA